MTANVVVIVCGVLVGVGLLAGLLGCVAFLVGK